MTSQEIHVQSTVRHMEIVFESILPQHWALKLLHRIAHKWVHIKEPDRSGMLKDFVHGRHFESFCIFVIISNALYSAYVADYEMDHLDESYTDTMNAVELGFLGFYSVELLLKMIVHGRYTFAN